jgi:radical SAM family uncharacterized protein
MTDTASPDPRTEPIPWEDIEALLHRVRRPGRYVGGEYNAIHKPWHRTNAHVCLAFPDLYELGMSNFAITLLYDILNQLPDVLAERTYLPAPDMIELLRAAELPLYTLESYRPVAAFDVLGVSTAYEQLYTNVLELLDLAGIPRHSAARTADDPLVVGGGHGTFNPEPIADFFDAFIIGEAEEVIEELVRTWQRVRDRPREAQLQALLPIEGVYVPRFYRPRYTDAGHRAATEPQIAAAPPQVRKRLVASLPPTPVRQLVPNIDITHNRGVVEIHRGCTRGCRFCQAGIITRPVRERSAAEVVDTVEALVDATGYEEIALLSLSSADHTEIEAMLEGLLARFEDRQLSISLPSLRIDAFSVELAEMLTTGRRSGFTFAPEAGSADLRQRINKDIATDDLLALAEEVFSRGWRTLKLYFMIGLPGETDEDVAGIVDMAQEVRRIGRRVGSRRTEVRVSVSTFVPKPHTVFQWEPLASRETIERRQAMLRRGLRGRGLHLSWNDYDATRLEALLARGDRRLGALIELAWRGGARFDAWGEWCDTDAWAGAIAELAVDLDAYLYRRRDKDDVLPWDHLYSGVARRFLWQDYLRSREGELLADCREGCHACGIVQTYPTLHTEAWACPTTS